MSLLKHADCGGFERWNEGRHSVVMYQKCHWKKDSETLEICGIKLSKYPYDFIETTSTWEKVVHVQL